LFDYFNVLFAYMEGMVLFCIGVEGNYLLPACFADSEWSLSWRDTPCLLPCGFRRSLCNPAVGILAAHKMLSRFLRTLLSRVVAPGCDLAVLRGIIPPVAPKALWRVPDEKSHGQHYAQRDPEGVFRFIFRHEGDRSGDLFNPQCSCYEL
jgi:hypothetical protein